MGLYQKYRPDSLDAVVGNVGMKTALQTLIERGEFPHACLFTGPTGCGKTTMARIVANSLGSKGGDLREIDSADFRGIDTVRELRKNSQYAPLEGSCRVWIIDECHKMTNDAQSALLKILEDTPPHVYFILCTTDPQKLLPTIKGRCSQYQVELLSEEQVIQVLRRAVKGEGERLTKQVYLQIAEDSLGHARNALQILEQVLSVDEELRAEVAKRSAEQQSQTIELCRALIGKRGWKEVASILTGLKDQEAESIRRAVLGYCQAILLKKKDDNVAGVMESFIDNFYDSGFPGLTFACYSAVNGCFKNFI